jgi:Rieske Fe-S protein
VQWRESEDRYVCPCHAGYFGKEGEVISGPPPKPLRQFAVKIENDILYAQI